MQAEVSDFLHYCRIERRRADLTCSAYERDVTACVRFLNESGIDDLRLVRPPDLRRFLVAEAGRRPAIGSQARTAAALKCFFRFCVENETLDRDPALVLRVPKKREALPDVLDRREMARLLAVTERNDVWKRHYPARRLLRELGARPGDAEWHSTTSENAGSARSAVHDSRGLGCGRWTRIGTGSRLNATS
jgi:site-specific recombinase XerD